VRNSLHQLADFRFQKLICHYQRPHRFARVTAAGRNGFVGCRFKPGRRPLVGPERRFAALAVSGLTEGWNNVLFSFSLSIHVG
jgi:hypothetical protein